MVVMWLGKIFSHRGECLFVRTFNSSCVKTCFLGDIGDGGATAVLELAQSCHKFKHDALIAVQAVERGGDVHRQTCVAGIGRKFIAVGVGNELVVCGVFSVLVTVVRAEQVVILVGDLFISLASISLVVGDMDKFPLVGHLVFCILEHPLVRVSEEISAAELRVVEFRCVYAGDAAHLHNVVEDVAVDIESEDRRNLHDCVSEVSAAEDFFNVYVVGVGVVVVSRFHSLCFLVIGYCYRSCFDC